MKNYFLKLSLTSAAFLIFALMLGAQDIITMRDYSIVRASVSEITDDTVTYKLSELADGPVFKAKTSNVVSIQFASGAIQYFNACGKIVSTHEEAIKSSANQSGDASPYIPQNTMPYSAKVEYNDNKLYFVDSQGRPLREIESQDMPDPQMYSRYISNSLMANAGEWLWIFGLSWLSGTLAGCLLAPEGALSDGQLAAIILPGTLIPLAIGVPLDVIGSRNVRKIGEEYNRQNTVTCSFGGQRHGIGLAINF